MDGVGVVFAIAKDSRIDMRMHYNALRKLEELTGERVVLVFDKLKPNSINSLISRQTPFVLEEKQIYMPFALAQIRTQAKPMLQNQYQKLNPLAQTILIGYLWGEIKNGMMIKEIADKIGAEIRASSKALEILDFLGYLDIERDGISKKAYFCEKIDIYEKLSKEAITPIQWVKYTKALPTVLYACSGNSALAKFSNILDNKIKTVAIGYKASKELKWQDIECEEDEASFLVEIWDRDPHCFFAQRVHKSCLSHRYNETL